MKHLLQGLSTKESSIIVAFFFNKRAWKEDAKDNAWILSVNSLSTPERMPDAMSSLTKAFLEKKNGKHRPGAYEDFHEQTSNVSIRAVKDEDSVYFVWP